MVIAEGSGRARQRSGPTASSRPGGTMSPGIEAYQEHVAVEALVEIAHRSVQFHASPLKGAGW